MTAFEETISECLKCKKEYSYYGMPKHISVMKKGWILPLCEDCSKLVEDFIYAKKEI